MDRREFSKSLEAYYREKGKPPPPHEPRLAGKAVSLYQLFERVTKLGGSHVIGKEDKWQDILQAFNLTPPSASLAYGLRKIYKQYLESFEKLQLYGEEPQEEEDDELRFRMNDFSDISETRRVRDDSYSQSYDRHVRRRIGDSSQSQYTHDPNFQSRFKPEPPEWRMINSLQSCLPNEVNFVLNTLLLYCSDHHRKRLRLERCPHLLDALMLHAGCPTSADLVIYAQWQENSGLRLRHFWEEKLAQADDLKCLLGMDAEMSADEPTRQGGFINGEKDREGQRIRHILVIIRNICQDQRDVHIVRRSEHVMQFILRCAFVENDVGLREQALETIAVIIQSDKADKNIRSPVWVEEPYISLILELISRLIRRPDKLIQIRILEIYAQLLEQTIVEGDCEDGDVERRNVRAETLRRLIPDLTDHILPLLTLPDCELLIASLEALNAIARSPLGGALCRHESISVLVDLLSFSSRNCDFSRLRFYGPRQPEMSHPPLIVTPRIPRRIAPGTIPPPNAAHPNAMTSSPAPSSSNAQNGAQNSPQRNSQPPRQNALQAQNASRLNTPIKVQRTAPQSTPREGLPTSAKEEQNSIQSFQWSFARSFISRRLCLAEDNSMISRQGIFLEYTSMAKQQGKIDGVSGVPILNVPEFTRLIRELFPTSQLINDSQNRQVFSGVAIKKDPDKDQKDTAEMSNNNGKVANGVGSPRVNGTKEDIPVKENGHNGTISYDEDSNHSQQSLDSVGGGKISHSGAQPPKVPPNHVDEDGLANHVPVNGKSNASAATGGTPPTPAQTMAKDAQMVKNNVKSEVTDADHMTNDKSDRHSNGTTTDKTDSAVNGHSDKENDHDNKDNSSRPPVANGSIIKVTVNNNLKKRLQPEIESPPKEGAPPPPKQRIIAQSGAPAGLRVLLQNAGTFIFDDFTDDREDCLTRSVRIQAALVLLTLTEQSSAEGSKAAVLPLMSRFEERISLIAASRQDASPVLARLLAFIP